LEPGCEVCIHGGKAGSRFKVQLEGRARDHHLKDFAGGEASNSGLDWEEFRYKCSPRLGLEPRDGNTVVQTEESWEGLLVRIFRGVMRKMLQRSIDAGLLHLKTEAERRRIFE
jgi:hypothetical protein